MALVPGLVVNSAIFAEANGSFTAPEQIVYWSPNAPGTGPTFAPNPWDKCYFNGQSLPGVWKVRGLPTLAIDKKKHAGTDGLAITSNGYIPGPVEIEGLIWTPQQWGLMQTFAPQIWRRPTKDAGRNFPVALAARIEHPALALWGISKFVVVGVSPPEPGPIRQSMSIKIKGIEFVPIDTVTRTKTAGAPTVPLAQPLQPQPGTASARPPSETDGGIHGAAPDTIGGAP
jgi:hypothetical protein